LLQDQAIKTKVVRKFVVKNDASFSKVKNAKSIINKRSSSKGKILLKKKKKHDDPDSDEEGWPCLVCAEPYEKSNSREKWIRCNECKKWSNLLCTAVEKEQLGYVCEICLDDSD